MKTWKTGTVYDFSCWLMSMVFLMGILAACSAKRDAAYFKPEVSKIVEDAGISSLMKEADSYYKGRMEKENMKLAIETYEKVLAKDASRKDILEKLSLACYWYANGHLTEKAEKVAYFHKGAQYGEMAMAMNSNFRACLETGKRDDECLETLGQEDISGAYWTFVNLGKWSNEQGFVAILKNKNKLKAFADWVTRTDELFYYGAGHRALGVYYSKAPSFAGGDIEKSKEHFTKSLAIAPDYFATKVLMAEFYAYKSQDRDMYITYLNDVINADPSVIPGIEFEQTMEQARARHLLKDVENKF